MVESDNVVVRILRDAAGVVAAADLPEDLRSVAFAKAVDLIAAGEMQRSEHSPARPTPHAGASGVMAPSDIPQSEDALFAELARESGVAEQDLRDILQLTSDGSVQVTPPTKDLGSSAAEQAKSVIALVAGGRSKGLGERPVNAEAVRREVDRKHCYQRANFATKHLAKMRGFNAGSTRNEIVLTSKWVDEFTAAVAKAHGRANSTRP